MHNAARRIEARAVFQEVGELVSAVAEGFRVRTAMAELTARRAVSCLVEPRSGDRVLIATEEGGDSFLLAVLDRREVACTTIGVEGDLVVRAPRGKVSVAAQEGIDMVAGAPIRVAASAVEVSAALARFSAQLLEVFGGTVKTELGKVKMLASTFDSVFDRFSQRIRRSYRTVEEMDQLRAGQIDYAAEGNAHLRGENALVTAVDVVKVNADQVHLG